MGTDCYACRHSSDPAERDRESLGEKREKKAQPPTGAGPKDPATGDRGPGRGDQMVRDQGVQMGRAGRRLVRQ